MVIADMIEMIVIKQSRRKKNVGINIDRAMI